jgi:hypothetical protein
MLKNCGSIVYILLGQHRFLYTLSKVNKRNAIKWVEISLLTFNLMIDSLFACSFTCKVSRWWLLQSPGREHSLQVALYGLDCVQAWGEAFEVRLVMCQYRAGANITSHFIVLNLFFATYTSKFSHYNAAEKETLSALLWHLHAVESQRLCPLCQTPIRLHSSETFS